MNAPILPLLRVFGLMTLAIALPQPSALAQRAPVNPNHTVGAESCRDCHESIVDSWERSRHATSFASLAKSDAAQAMAKNIGIKADTIATNASCVRCHFTQEQLSGAVQTTAAVSCESCHGGASEWIDIHNSKSLPRAERVAKAASLGMHHPAMLATTGKTCFECHIIDDEQLVNKGGHPAMSARFDLLAWYSGEVKHNYLVAQPGKPVKRSGSEPQPIAATHQRMLFLTGKLLHLGQSLRALSHCNDAPVTKDGKLIRLPDGKPTYGVQHALAVRELSDCLKKLNAELQLPEYTQALALLESLPLTTGHSEELAGAAREIEQLAEHFGKSHDGAQFAAVDGMLKGLPVPGAPESKATSMAGR